jgi:SAM-dependent methyltransferase
MAEPPALSFRDPAGRLLLCQDRVLRVVNSRGAPDLRAFLNSSAARRLAAAHSIVKTHFLSSPADVGDYRAPCSAELSECESVLEHERIAFASYPYEWTPEMLHAAAQLTLDIAEQCFDEGLGLKDATPWNVLFRGPSPVFVDMLSFERREPRDPVWLPFAQFVSTFILPLLVSRKLGITPDQIFRTRRDGLRPEEVYGWLWPLRRVLPPFLGAVSIPVWLSRFEHNELYQPREVDSPEKAKFILKSLLGRLRRMLNRLRPVPRSSAWSAYMEERPSYGEDQFAAKVEFVSHCLEACAPRRLLDAGSNSGFFSLMAARLGASVVAVDNDPAVAGRLWRDAAAAHLDILPLVMDISRPSAALGWRNRESAAFLDRARGYFDTTLMLGLFHHLFVAERAPLDEIAALAADLTTRFLIIEYVGPDDPMFRRLARGRDALTQYLTPSLFEKAFSAAFEIRDSRAIPSSARGIYLLRKRS